MKEKRKFRLICVLTTKCNLRCEHCYYQTGSSRIFKKELNVLNLCDFLTKNKKYIRGITLTGGEPFLYSQFSQLIQFLIESKLEFNLNTNLTLLDEQKRKFIMKAPINYISASFDAPLNFRKDLLHKSHLVAAKNLTRLLKNKGNAKIRIVCTMSKQNYSYLEKIYQSFKELNIDDFVFQPIYIPRDSSDFNKYSLFTLSKENLSNIFHRLQPWAEKFGYLSYLQFLKELFLNKKIFKRFPCCASKTLYLEPDGKIYPCFNSNYVVGKITACSVQDITKNKTFQKIKSYSKNLSCFEEKCLCAMPNTFKSN